MNGVRGLGWKCPVCSLVGLALGAGSASAEDAEGRPLAAVQLAVPAEAYTPKQLLDLGPKITVTAQRIAEALD